MTSRRQLALFKTEGPRRPPAEFPVHVAIADTLRRSITPGWIWFHCPNGGERLAEIVKDGRRVSKEGGRLKRMGVRPGVSDFLLIAPQGACLHALELKRRGEEPSDVQELFLEEVRRAGGRAAWCDNYADAVRILGDWGALRHRIEVAA